MSILILISIMSLISLVISLSCSNKYYSHSVNSFTGIGNSDAPNKISAVQNRIEGGCLKTVDQFPSFSEFEVKFSFQVTPTTYNVNGREFEKKIIDGFIIWFSKDSNQQCLLNKVGMDINYDGTRDVILFEYDPYQNTNLNDGYASSMNIKSCLGSNCYSFENNEINGGTNRDAPILVSI